MKIFFRYLGYRLKSSALRTLIFTALSVAICLIGISEVNTSNEIKYCQSGLFMLATVLCITASIVPLFELSGLKNRRNLDTLYFFPIKREKMAMVHFVSGLVQVVAIYTVTWGASYLWLALNTDYFALVYMIPYYFLSLLLAFVIYSIYCFLFMQANTVADGVLFCALWIFLPCIVALSASWVFDSRIADNLAGWGIMYTPMNNLTVLFQDLVEINRPDYWRHGVEEITDRWYMFFIWGAVGIAAANGYLISFVKKGAEQAGEISNSPFGYALLIPVYGYCFMTMPFGIYIPISLVVYLIIMLSGYLIYRRGFKFKIPDIVVTVIGLVLPFVVAYIQLPDAMSHF